MVYATSKSNIEVIGGDWNKNNVQWEVFTFNSCTDIIIRDLEAHNAVYDGIACNKCDRITVSNVEIGTVGHTALVMGQTSNSVVEDCHFYDCRTGGGCYFLVEDVANGVSSNNEMRNNLVERTYLSGLSLCSLRAASDVGTNNIADGNTCIDCGRDGSHPGIACGWSEGVVSNIATDCTISDNLVYGTGAYSLGGGMMLTVSDSLVTNNTVHDTTDFGMAVFGSRNTISYNTIYDVVTSCYPGIVLQDASNNQVVHNTISHCPYGVMVVYDDTGSGCNYNHIAYNHFESISYQIAYVHDKACVGNIFESNTYKGTWTAYDAGTGTIIRNNIKQL
jgi:parallel beta-helix repeat protein